MTFDPSLGQRGVCCSTPDDCLLVGGDGTGCSAFSVVTHDGGQTWGDTHNWSGRPDYGDAGCSIGGEGSTYLFGGRGVVVYTDTFGE